MNTSQILAPLFSQLWWMIPLFLIVGAIKAFKPFLKGKMGELAVSTHVKLYLDKEMTVLCLMNRTKPHKSTIFY